MPSPPTGSIGWIDLTIENASAVRDFYAQVAGWQAAPIDMGGYDDYGMIPPGSDQPVAGICHARGENADQPSQWIIYITVADIQQSLDACVQHGGEIVRPLRPAGEGSMAVIRDPAGALCAFYQSGADAKVS